jgi:glycosyltransferase involved in cell wall biosynthesis
MKSPSRIRLCTIGNVVHDPRPNGDQDRQTYVSLSLFMHRIYVIVKSPSRRDHVTRSGRVIVVALGQRKGILWSRLAFLGGAVRVSRRLNRRADVDVYAVSDPLFSGIVGLTLRCLTRKPLLVHLQGQLLSLPPGGISRMRRWGIVALARFVCRRADMVRCVSRSLMHTAWKVGVPSHRLAYLPSRVDTEVFSPRQVAVWRSVIREELGAEQSKVLLFVGTFSLHKGVTNLIGAMPQVVRRHPDVKLVLAGSGPLEHRLRQLVQRLGLTKSVMFVGRKSHDQMPQLAAAADVLVSPSLNEGLPRVILEAMATGLPVVATSVGGVPELVIDGRTGLLVRPGDKSALANALCRILADPDSAKAWGRAGRTMVEHEYERKANLRRYAQIVETVASSGRSSEIRCGRPARQRSSLIS